MTPKIEIYLQKFVLEWLLSFISSSFLRRSSWQRGLILSKLSSACLISEPSSICILMQQVEFINTVADIRIYTLINIYTDLSLWDYRRYSDYDQDFLRKRENKKTPKNGNNIYIKYKQFCSRNIKQLIFYYYSEKIYLYHIIMHVR